MLEDAWADLDEELSRVNGRIGHLQRSIDALTKRPSLGSGGLGGLNLFVEFLIW